MADFRVGDKVRIKDTTLQATQRAFCANDSMARTAREGGTHIVKSTDDRSIYLECNSWRWHKDDFELVSPAYISDIEVGDSIEVLFQCDLNGRVEAGSILECIEHASRNYGTFGFKFKKDIELPNRKDRNWGIIPEALKKELEKGNIRIIKQNAADSFMKEAFKAIPKINGTESSIEKEIKMYNIADYPTCDKILYSKLTDVQKEQWKMGLINLNGGLTTDGQKYVKEYVENKYREEALAALVTTIKAVNAEAEVRK